MVITIDVEGKEIEEVVTQLHFLGQQGFKVVNLHGQLATEPDMPLTKQREQFDTFSRLLSTLGTIAVMASENLRQKSVPPTPPTQPVDFVTPSTATGSSNQNGGDTE